MFQAILTKYFGPTDTRPGRIKAWAEVGSITVPYDDALNTEQNHTAAAQALQAKWGWDAKYTLIGGGTGDGMAFVQVKKPDAN